MSAESSQLTFVPKRPRTKVIKEKEEENVRGLRRSPRNLPDHLKKQLEEEVPVVEKDPDISTLPPITFKGRINYTSDFYQFTLICDNIIQDIEKCDLEFVPLGFDLEWPFSFQTGSGKTALVQICISVKVCHLIHIHELPKLPPAFVALLKHPKVRLVGVNIKNDIWKLARDFKEVPAKEIVENNCIDCGPFANSAYDRSCRWSLERLTAYLLKKKIDKNPEVRRSKWHIEPLSNAQKLYAATDAYVSLLLYNTIKEKLDTIANSKAKEESLKSSLHESNLLNGNTILNS